MPPRARRHDEARLRAAWAAQWSVLADAGEPAAAGAAEELRTALAAAAPPRATATALGVLTASAAAVPLAGGGPYPSGPGPTDRLAGAAADLERAAPGRFVATRYGDLALGDLLLLQVTGALVRGVDRGLEPGEGLDAEAVRVVSRLLVDVLAARAPGRSVEVRVTDPGLRLGVAGQCVAGPRHARGTPPNVVAVRSAAAWLRLATGRLDWARAVADGQVLASGERSDLSGLLPLVSAPA